MKKLLILFNLIVALAFSYLIIPGVYANTITLTMLRAAATQAANKYGVEVSLAHAIIKPISGWNPKITSRVGAIGLMPIMPSTGKSFCGLSEIELFY